MDPRLRPPTGGLLSIMKENARKLGEIRKLCNKVAVIRNMGQQPPGMYQPPPPPSKLAEIDDYAWGGEVDAEEPVFVPDATAMNGELGRYVMEQAIAKLLYHTGFEDFQPSALDVMTSVAIEYLQDIGKTLRLYMNNVDGRKKFSAEVPSDEVH